MHHRISSLILALCFVIGVHGDVHQTENSPKTVEELQQLGKQVIPLKLVRHVSPDYPEKLRRRKITGTVVLTFTVDENGIPQDVKVKSSSNHGFDADALQAIRQWRFQPAEVDGEAAAVITNAEVNFKLY